MNRTLNEIANELKNSSKKTHLIYAFNGTGKTRLSKEFKHLYEVSGTGENDETITEEMKDKVLYYNAFTEDLFYWDNDLENGVDLKLKIQPNRFIRWIFNEEGRGDRVTEHFQRYTNDKLTPTFTPVSTPNFPTDNKTDADEIKFSFERGNNEVSEQVKISKGEESNYIWSIFYSLLDSIIETLNIPDADDRSTSEFNELEYVFIDDPITSLDDNHLIEVAVDLAGLIKSSESNLKFIITTHNPLFYNVLHNELNNRVKEDNARKYRLEKFDDGTYALHEQGNDSPFAYHLFLLEEVQKAVRPSGKIEKYHFMFLRNIFEKTATFLGYSKWEELLPADNREAYAKRILNLLSHSKQSGEETPILSDNDKNTFRYIFNTFMELNNFKITPE